MLAGIRVLACGDTVSAHEAAAVKAGAKHALDPSSVPREFLYMSKAVLPQLPLAEPRRAFNVRETVKPKPQRSAVPAPNASSRGERPAARGDVACVSTPLQLQRGTAFARVRRRSPQCLRSIRAHGTCPRARKWAQAQEHRAGKPFAEDEACSHEGWCRRVVREECACGLLTQPAVDCVLR